VKRSLSHILVIVAGMMLGSHLAAQDTVSIPGVTVQASRIERLSGYKQTHIDSLVLKQFSTNAFSDLLSRHSPLFIKSYGQGALATASFRGTSASHTKVRWNGVEINSPMLGQTDFSTIPVYMADRISLNHGGSSIVRGSGALGGSVSFESEVDWSENLRMNLIQDIGSFDTYKTSSAIQLGNTNFQSRTKFHYSASDNDFSFKNNFKDRENPPTEIRDHADYQHSSLLQEFFWKPGNGNVLSAHIWAQDYHRNIAPPLGVSGEQRDEEQRNRFLRSILSWKKQLKQTTLDFRTAYLYDYINYKNDVANINSDNYSHQWLTSAGISSHLTDNLALNAQVKFRHDRVNSDNYQGKKTRNSITAFAGLEYSISQRLITRLMLRQQVVNEDFIPLIPSLGLDYQILANEQLYVKANLSRNYRIPTLNDLYWSPGGNRDLKPEQGISWELGLDYAKSLSGQLEMKTSLTGYQSSITNWISWQPDSVMSYWTPQNFRSVTSKGLESKIKLNWHQNHTRIEAEGSYYLTRTYNDDSDFNARIAGKEQFIYVPKHSYSVNGLIRRKEIQANLTYRYTGKRFTSPENTSYMPAFRLMDVGFTYFVKADSFSGEVALRINNVFDTDYQVIAWRPMPGRNFHLILKLNLFE